MVTIMPDVQSDTAAEKTLDKAQRRAAEAVETEARSFAGTKDGGQGPAQASFDAARDMARRGAAATRQIAESGRQTTFEIADLWRDAFGPILKTQLEMNRLFDQVWRQATGLGAFPGLSAARPFAALSPAPLFGLPPADLKETARAYELVVEVPGLAREDLDLKILGDLLVLTGRKAEEKVEGSAAYRVSERRFGRFERSFPIPPDVRREALEAAYADGLLRITLPKTGEAAPAGASVPIR